MYISKIQKLKSQLLMREHLNYKINDNGWENSEVVVLLLKREQNNKQKKYPTHIKGFIYSLIRLRAISAMK